MNLITVFFYFSWCHRIFPIQATCNLDEQALRDVVQNLVLQYVKSKGQSIVRPVKVVHSDKAVIPMVIKFNFRSLIRVPTLSYIFEP